MEIRKPDKEYHSNHSLVYSCQYHIIFCPKHRRKVLVDGVDIELKKLILEKQSQYGYKVLELEILPEHVHLLLDINPQIGVIKVISQIKGYSAHSLRQKFPWLKSRLPCMWTRSKFISTVGAVSLDVVKKYIESQKDQ